MKSAIEKLLNGETECYDKPVTSEEYGRLQYEAENIYENLLKTLTEEQKLILESLYNKMLAMQGEGNRFHYKEGFKLGLAVAVEAVK